MGWFLDKYLPKQPYFDEPHEYTLLSSDNANEW